MSFSDCFPSLPAGTPSITPDQKTSHNNHLIPNIQPSSTLQPVRNVEKDLVTFVERCDQLMSTLHTVINTTEDLLQQHATTTQKTKEIHGRCHHLLTSKDKLDDIVKQIVEPLSYFDCLDKLCSRVGLPPESQRFGTDDEVSFDVTPLDLQSVEADSPEIFDVLDKTAACLKYLRAHQSFRDSSDYISGFLVVEKRALLLIKNDVFEKLTRETTKILNHMDHLKTIGLESDGGGSQQQQQQQQPSSATNLAAPTLLMDGSDHLELLPPYTWWGSIGDALRGQLGEITRRARESRVQNTRDGSSRTGRNNNNRRRRSQDESDVLNDEDEHGAILHECQRFYFSQRIRLIGDIVQERLIILAAGRTATELACLGCTLLGHVASIEAKLFASFFTPELRDSNNRRRHSTTLSVSNKEEDDDAL